MLRTGIIYLITNKVNGRQYVGQTSRRKSDEEQPTAEQLLGRRWEGHKTDAKNQGKLLIHPAIREYGAENFTTEVIAEYPDNCLNFAEKLFVKLFNTVTPNGYNIYGGGFAPHPTPLSPRRRKAEERRREAAKQLMADTSAQRPPKRRSFGWSKYLFD